MSSQGRTYFTLTPLFLNNNQFVYYAVTGLLIVSGLMLVLAYAYTYGRNKVVLIKNPNPSGFTLQRYLLSFHTSPVPGSGLSQNVLVRVSLAGDKGSTPYVSLTRPLYPYSTFRRAQEDVYLLQFDRGVGDVREVHLYMENVDLENTTWFLTDVVVYDPQGHSRWHFPVGHEIVLTSDHREVRVTIDRSATRFSTIKRFVVDRLFTLHSLVTICGKPLEAGGMIMAVKIVLLTATASLLYMSNLQAYILSRKFTTSTSFVSILGNCLIAHLAVFAISCLFEIVARNIRPKFSFCEKRVDTSIVTTLVYPQCTCCDRAVDYDNYHMEGCPQASSNAQRNISSIVQTSVKETFPPTVQQVGYVTSKLNHKKSTELRLSEIPVKDKPSSFCNDTSCTEEAQESSTSFPKSNTELASIQNGTGVAYDEILHNRGMKLPREDNAVDVVAQRLSEVSEVPQDALETKFSQQGNTPVRLEEYVESPGAQVERMKSDFFVSGMEKAAELDLALLKDILRSHQVIITPTDDKFLEDTDKQRDMPPNKTRKAKASKRNQDDTKATSLKSNEELANIMEETKIKSKKRSKSITRTGTSKDQVDIVSSTSSQDLTSDSSCSKVSNIVKKQRKQRKQKTDTRHSEQSANRSDIRIANNVDAKHGGSTDKSRKTKGLNLKEKILRSSHKEEALNLLVDIVKHQNNSKFFEELDQEVNQLDHLLRADGAERRLTTKFSDMAQESGMHNVAEEAQRTHGVKKKSNFRYPDKKDVPSKSRNKYLDVVELLSDDWKSNLKALKRIHYAKRCEKEQIKKELNELDTIFSLAGVDKNIVRKKLRTPDVNTGLEKAANQTCPPQMSTNTKSPKRGFREFPSFANVEQKDDISILKNITGHSALIKEIVELDELLSQGSASCSQPVQRLISSDFSEGKGQCSMPGGSQITHNLFVKNKLHMTAKYPTDTRRDVTVLLKAVDDPKKVSGLRRDIQTFDDILQVAGASESQTVQDLMNQINQDLCEIRWKHADKTEEVPGNTLKYAEWMTDLEIFRIMVKEQLGGKYQELIQDIHKHDTSLKLSGVESNKIVQNFMSLDGDLNVRRQGNARENREMRQSGFSCQSKFKLASKGLYNRVSMNTKERRDSSSDSDTLEILSVRSDSSSRRKALEFMKSVVSGKKNSPALQKFVSDVQALDTILVRSGVTDFSVFKNLDEASVSGALPDVHTDINTSVPPVNFNRCQRETSSFSPRICQRISSPLRSRRSRSPGRSKQAISPERQSQCPVRGRQRSPSDRSKSQSHSQRNESQSPSHRSKSRSPSPRRSRHSPGVRHRTTGRKERSLPTGRRRRSTYSEMTRRSTCKKCRRSPSPESCRSHSPGEISTGLSRYPSQETFIEKISEEIQLFGKVVEQTDPNVLKQFFSFEASSPIRKFPPSKRRRSPSVERGCRSPSTKTHGRTPSSYKNRQSGSPGRRDRSSSPRESRRSGWNRQSSTPVRRRSTSSESERHSASPGRNIRSLSPETPPPNMRGRSPSPGRRGQSPSVIGQRSPSCESRRFSSPLRKRRSSSSSSFERPLRPPSPRMNRSSPCSRSSRSPSPGSTRVSSNVSNELNSVPNSNPSQALVSKIREEIRLFDKVFEQMDPDLLKQLSHESCDTYENISPPRPRQEYLSPQMRRKFSSSGRRRRCETPSIGRNDRVHSPRRTGQPLSPRNRQRCPSLGSSGSLSSSEGSGRSSSPGINRRSSSRRSRRTRSRTRRHLSTYRRRTRPSQSPGWSSRSSSHRRKKRSSPSRRRSSSRRKPRSPFDERRRQSFSPRRGRRSPSAGTSRQSQCRGKISTVILDSVSTLLNPCQEEHATKLLEEIQRFDQVLKETDLLNQFILYGNSDMEEKSPFPVKKETKIFKYEPRVDKERRQKQDAFVTDVVDESKLPNPISGSKETPNNTRNVSEIKTNSFEPVLSGPLANAQMDPSAVLRPDSKTDIRNVDAKEIERIKCVIGGRSPKVMQDIMRCIKECDAILDRHNFRESPLLKRLINVGDETNISSVKLSDAKTDHEQTSFESMPVDENMATPRSDSKKKQGRNEILYDKLSKEISLCEDLLGKTAKDDTGFWPLLVLNRAVSLSKMEKGCDLSLQAEREHKRVKESEGYENRVTTRHTTSSSKYSNTVENSKTPKKRKSPILRTVPKGKQSLMGNPKAPFYEILQDIEYFDTLLQKSGFRDTPMLHHFLSDELKSEEVKGEYSDPGGTNDRGNPENKCEIKSKKLSPCGSCAREVTTSSSLSASKRDSKSDEATMNVLVPEAGSHNTDEGRALCTQGGGTSVLESLYLPDRRNKLVNKVLEEINVFHNLVNSSEEFDYDSFNRLLGLLVEEGKEISVEVRNSHDEPQEEPKEESHVVSRKAKSPKRRVPLPESPGKKPRTSKSNRSPRRTNNKGKRREKHVNSNPYVPSTHTDLRKLTRLPQAESSRGISSTSTPKPDLQTHPLLQDNLKKPTPLNCAKISSDTSFTSTPEPGFQTHAIVQANLYETPNIIHSEFQLKVCHCVLNILATALTETAEQLAKQELSREYDNSLNVFHRYLVTDLIVQLLKRWKIPTHSHVLHQSLQNVYKHLEQQGYTRMQHPEVYLSKALLLQRLSQVSGNRYTLALWPPNQLNESELGLTQILGVENSLAKALQKTLKSRLKNELRTCLKNMKGHLSFSTSLRSPRSYLCSVFLFYIDHLSDNTASIPQEVFREVLEKDWTPKRVLSYKSTDDLKTIKRGPGKSSGSPALPTKRGRRKGTVADGKKGERKKKALVSGKKSAEGNGGKSSGGNKSARGKEVRPAGGMRSSNRRSPGHVTFAPDVEEQRPSQSTRQKGESYRTDIDIGELVDPTISKDFKLLNGYLHYVIRDEKLRQELEVTQYCLSNKDKLDNFLLENLQKASDFQHSQWKEPKLSDELLLGLQYEVCGHSKRPFPWLVYPCLMTMLWLTILGSLLYTAIKGQDLSPDESGEWIACVLIGVLLEVTVFQPLKIVLWESVWTLLRALLKEDQPSSACTV